MVHQVMEDWLNNKPIDSEDEEKFVTPFIQLVTEFDKSNIIAEKILWNHEHKVAGTTDVLQDFKRYNLFYSRNSSRCA